MSDKFGPTRGEILFRLCFSLGGLLLFALMIAVMGWPGGPAGVEVAVVVLAFFGGTAIWALRRLIKMGRKLD